MLKWAVLGTIIFAAAIVAAIFFLGAFAPTEPKLTTILAPNASLNTTGSALTLDLVAQHSSANDCWIIVQGKVYNVTSFLPRHPGGTEILIPFCGRDASSGFDTKGGKGQHSASAQSLLRSFYVGDLSLANR